MQWILGYLGREQRAKIFLAAQVNSVLPHLFSRLYWKSKEITLGAKNIKVDARPGALRANAIAPLLDIWQKLATCVAFTKRFRNPAD